MKHPSMIHAPFCTFLRLGAVRRLWPAAFILSLAACADELTLEPDDRGGPADDPVITEAADDGSFITRVDATDEAAWIHFSFDSRAQALPADPASSPDWDLAFQRFHIISNGGVSGTGGVAVAVLMGTPFESVRTPPDDGYTSDQADDEDDDSVQTSAFEAGDGWYDYDSATNRLSPRPHVYVVETARGAFFKLQLLDYYDSAGTSGHPSFNWAPL